MNKLNWLSISILLLLFSTQTYAQRNFEESFIFSDSSMSSSIIGLETGKKISKIDIEKAIEYDSKYTDWDFEVEGSYIKYSHKTGAFRILGWSGNLSQYWKYDKSNPTSGNSLFSHVKHYSGRKQYDLFSELQDGKNSIKVIYFQDFSSPIDDYFVLGYNIYTGKSMMYKDISKPTLDEKWNENIFVELADGKNPISVDYDIDFHRDYYGNELKSKLESSFAIAAMNSKTGVAKIITYKSVSINGQAERLAYLIAKRDYDNGKSTKWPKPLSKKTVGKFARWKKMEFPLGTVAIKDYSLEKDGPLKIKIIADAEALKENYFLIYYTAYTGKFTMYKRDDKINDKIKFVYAQSGNMPTDIEKANDWELAGDYCNTVIKVKGESEITVGPVLTFFSPSKHYHKTVFNYKWERRPFDGRTMISIGKNDVMLISRFMLMPSATYDYKHHRNNLHEYIFFMNVNRPSKSGLHMYDEKFGKFYRIDVTNFNSYIFSR